MGRIHQQRPIPAVGLAMWVRAQHILAVISLLVLVSCSRKGLEIRTSGVATLEAEGSCWVSKEGGDSWSGIEFCGLRSPKTLAILGSRALPGFGPKGLALLAKPDTDLKFFLEDGKSFMIKTDAEGFAAFEVSSKSPIAYFLIRYSPKEQLKCDAEVGGPVCESVT
jgi:hypothetical protein